jgi:hypothetical protein
MDHRIAQRHRWGGTRTFGDAETSLRNSRNRQLHQFEWIVTTSSGAFGVVAGADSTILAAPRAYAWEVGMPAKEFRRHLVQLGEFVSWERAEEQG